MNFISIVVERQLHPKGGSSSPGSVLEHKQYQDVTTSEPRTQNPEPRTQNPEPRTQNPEPIILAIKSIDDNGKH
jgi:hypothetical protein